MKVETRIPFEGFYESVHSDNMDRQLIDEELSIEEQEKLYDEIDWKAQRIEYAKEFTKLVAALLKMDLEFVALESPREYNFGTDRIFALIKEEDVKKLKELVDPGKMTEYVKEHFSSRPGFCSFYDHDYEKWLHQEKAWDHNQIAALIEVYLIQECGENWEPDDCMPTSF